MTLKEYNSFASNDMCQQILNYVVKTNYRRQKNKCETSKTDMFRKYEIKVNLCAYYTHLIKICTI